MGSSRSISAGFWGGLAAVTAGLLMAAGPACAQADFDPEARAWQRHGGVSRAIWSPTGARVELAGQQAGFGFALGLRRNLRRPLGTHAAPAFVVETGVRSNLTLLAAPDRGAMLVWQVYVR
jgi:hypothetical protein